VDTRGYQISVFPVGTPAGENGQRPGRIAAESITWSGKSGLNPSLAARDQEAETAAGHDTFVAGISFGIASRTAVAFFGVLWEGLRPKKKASDAVRAGDAAGPGTYRRTCGFRMTWGYRRIERPSAPGGAPAAAARCLFGNNSTTSQVFFVRV
jgi:hypothetical protein